MPSALSVLDPQLRESFPMNLLKAEELLFPLLTQMSKTSVGVTERKGASGEIGRGFQVVHKYMSGLAGRRTPANPLGPTMVDIGVPILLEGSTANTDNTPYPKGNEAPHSSVMTRTLVMHRSTGCMSVLNSWRQANALSLAQYDMIFNDLKAAAEMEKRCEAISFHAWRVTNSAGYDTTVLGRIATGGVSAAFNAYTQAGVSTAGFVKFTLDESYGRIKNLAKGMEIDIAADSAGVLQCGTDTDGSDVVNYATDAATGYIQVIITDVDPINKTITCAGVSRAATVAHAFVAFSDTNGWGDGAGFMPAAGDWIVGRDQSRYAAGTRPMFSYGLNDFIKESGKIMGGAAGSQTLDLDAGANSEFKSRVKDDLAGPLIEMYLSQWLNGYAEAYPNIDLDTILTTAGVTQEFVSQCYTQGNNMGVFERTNKELQVKGGWTLKKFTGATKEYDWWTSPVGLSGHCYVIGMNNGNFQQYTPPHVGGSNASYGPEVQFLAPKIGFNDIWMPELDGNGRPTDMSVAYYDRYVLVAPKMPNGILIKGCTEASMLSL